MMLGMSGSRKGGHRYCEAGVADAAAPVAEEDAALGPCCCSWAPLSPAAGAGGGSCGRGGAPNPAPAPAASGPEGTTAAAACWAWALGRMHAA